MHTGLIGEIGKHTHTREDMTQITENDFMRNEARRLTELANLIRLSGETPREIAEACRLDKRTVQRALKRLPLKSDATERIQFYLKIRLQTPQQ